MPIYEFECQECHKRFEKLCSISAGADGVKCPDCNCGRVKRLMSGFFSKSSDSSSSSSSCGGCSKSTCSGCNH